MNLVADTEYCSETNLFVCAENLVIPQLAVGRGSHHYDPLDRDLPNHNRSIRMQRIWEGCRYHLLTMAGKVKGEMEITGMNVRQRE